MSGKINWTNYKKKEILFNDRSGLRNEAIIENVNIAVELIKKSGKKEILFFTLFM